MIYTLQQAQLLRHAPFLARAHSGDSVAGVRVRIYDARRHTEHENDYHLVVILATAMGQNYATRYQIRPKPCL